jgi:HNH endonuclease
MRCLFCKQDSSASRSVEHIIPESLGNLEHVLPTGTVCDNCNNYLARKVEKPILDSRYFQERRFAAAVPNKKGRVPTLDGVHFQSLTRVQLTKQANGADVFVGAYDGEEDSRLITSLLCAESGSFIFPVGSKPADYMLSRFIGKIGLEVCAQRVLGVPGGLDELIDKAELDQLREYVRKGSTSLVWPYSHRKLYSLDSVFKEYDERFEVLHEYDILVTPIGEYYIVVAIFGEEFALNLGGPELVGYERWLLDHENMSPLYFAKDA